MDCESYVHQIKRSIAAMPPGNVFCIRDLETECGSYDSIRKGLSKMAEIGHIKRIVNGVYQTWSPQDAEPEPTDVMWAVARNNAWKIVPATEQARYELGLSDKKPEVLCYVYGGRACSFAYGSGKRFRFIRANSKFINGMSYEAAKVISALSDLQHHPITAQDVFFLSNALSTETKKDLMRDRSSAPARLRPVIEIICGQYGVNAK